ncbi:histone acetyltransferase subunit NuA4-domain-containing protein [Lipomyces japonicus]|uniref:histone acetyltransferase subunit NuA4-domain-containing protein n=1 Tax=Lipomyces japonicus TaxID=56871 RepID=UPI0034CFDA53
MPDPSQLGAGIRDQPMIDRQEIANYEKLKKELRDLISKKKSVDKNLAIVEEQVFKIEGAYLEDTPYGNIIKGFDNYLKAGNVALLGSSSNSGGGSGAGSSAGGNNGVKRRGGYTDADRLFSLSSATYLRTVQKELFESPDEQSQPSSGMAMGVTPVSTSPATKATTTTTTSTAAPVTSGPKKKKRKKDEESSSESENDDQSIIAVPKRVKLNTKVEDDNDD